MYLILELIGFLRDKMIQFQIFLSLKFSYPTEYKSEMIIL